MVEKIEADLSKEYLFRLFSGLTSEERTYIGLMGGWAVEFTLNKIKVTHIGSKDIDIFFNTEKISAERVIEIIESRGFLKHSFFRWCKYINRENGKEMSEDEQRRCDLHNIIPVYVDVMTNKDLGGGRLFFEPLLDDVLEGEFEYFNYRGIDIMMPTTKLITELKIKTACERNDQEKRSKDIADLFSIINNSKTMWELDLKGNLIRIANIREDLRKMFSEKFDEFLSDGTISKGSNLINVDEKTVISMLRLIFA